MEGKRKKGGFWGNKDLNSLSTPAHPFHSIFQHEEPKWKHCCWDENVMSYVFTCTQIALSYQTIDRNFVVVHVLSFKWSLSRSPCKFSWPFSAPTTNYCCFLSTKLSPPTFSSFLQLFEPWWWRQEKGKILYLDWSHSNNNPSEPNARGKSMVKI